MQNQGATHFIFLTPLLHASLLPDGFVNGYVKQLDEKNISFKRQIFNKKIRRNYRGK